MSTWDDIDTFEAEEWGGGQEVAIVGVDFVEIVFGGASQMEGICSSEEYRAGGTPISDFEPLLDALGQRQPLKQSAFTVAGELLQQSVERSLIQVALPKRSMDCRNYLGLPMPR